MNCINHDLILIQNKNKNLFFVCLFCKTALPVIDKYEKICNCEELNWKFKIIQNEYYIYCDSCSKN